MNDVKIKIGQMNDWIEVFETTTSKSPTGQSNKTDVLFKKVWAMTNDNNASEKDGEKMYLYNIRTYTIRFDPVVFRRGAEMFINDFDGRYNITGIKQIGRKQFLELKTLKRE